MDASLPRQSGTISGLFQLSCEMRNLSPHLRGRHIPAMRLERRLIFLRKRKILGRAALHRMITGRGRGGALGPFPAFGTNVAAAVSSFSATSFQKQPSRNPRFAKKFALNLSTGS